LVHPGLARLLRRTRRDRRVRRWFGAFGRRSPGAFLLRGGMAESQSRALAGWTLSWMRRSRARTESIATLRRRTDPRLATSSLLARLACRAESATRRR